MPDTVGHQTIEALLPGGSAWAPSPGEDMDLTFEGMGANADTVAEFLATLAFVRDPLLTPYLDDLEKEYGIPTVTNLTEEVRRMRLATLVYNSAGAGTVDDMQDALDSAGFTVQVHENSPAVDPALFLDQSFQMVADGPAAFAGNQDAFAARIGGELLVNGDIFFQTAAILMQANGTAAFAGNADAVAGQFDSLNLNPIEYEIPTNPDDWPLIFFVGGDATRDGSGALTAIERGEVPIERETEFKALILKLKPIHSWAGLVITFV